ncbi:putative tyrosine-protein kinase [Apostichopus japonicus]|uniref:receptor protein-tyrosine kinase n=1 Tax=Stichopus japonicus TaxID=307972 RepID=A0A2G8LH21_STIJA|nr:putative tyrosine-protein kinase [Apostichopus japonicus]
MSIAISFRVTLGLHGALVYVRDDWVNQAAVRYVVPVPRDINRLYLTWSTEDTIFYSMDLVSENTRILYTPRTNISMDGQVPKELSVFRIDVRCTGKAEGDVEFRIQINVSIFSTRNITTLNLRRTKACYSKCGHQIISDTTEILCSRPEYPVVLGRIPQADNNQNASIHHHSSSIFYIGIGCLFGLIILVTLVGGLLRFLSVKTEDPVNGSDASSTGLLAHTMANSMYNKPANGQHQRIDFISLHPEITIMSDTETLKAKLQDIGIEKCRITFGDILLEGTFGRVYQGTLAPCPGSETESQSQTCEKEVLIKTIADHGSEKQKEILLNDSCLLQGLSHKNLLPIMHVALEGIPIVLFPFLKLGNLKKFLKDGRIGPGDKHQAVSTKDLVHLAIQVTHGMMYLGKRKVVHKDLATRNCVIDENYNLKITDNALSRDIFPSDYHCLGDNENRPVKWMAVESLVDRQFTSASDVWAFGVLLWELVTFGHTPYMDLDPFEMVNYLRSGYRMSQPHNCPDELFSLMACCWALMPQDRPKFSQLCAALTDFHRALGIYI